MAQKYSIIYNDVVNVEHEVKIYDDTYSDAVIDILGKVYLDSSRGADNLDAVRGLGLRVELEADADLTFSDLFSEEEKTFPITYLRDSVILFDGWINPEGWHEDFVNEKWIVSFDCVDGLGYLENLAFVNTDGTYITGRITQLEAISKALIRTGLQKDINVAIDIYYTGLSTSVCVLENVYIIAERYFKDDQQTTVMSCEEVLRDILEPYGAVLKSYGDAWYIYKPNQLYKRYQTYEDTEQDFYNFTYLGVSGTDFSESFDSVIGSHLNNYYPHHCNENQSLGLLASTGAYRINYKYGLVQSLIDNTTLCSDDGYSITDWSITEADSGTTDGTTANKLVDSTQNFVTTVSIGDIVHNTTDDTYALVTAVDSNTTLSLDADIMITGETYSIKDMSNLHALVAGECGVTFDTKILATEIAQLRTDESQIDAVTSIKTIIRASSDKTGGSSISINYRIFVSDKSLPDGTANIYYLQDDLTWGASGVTNTLTFPSYGTQYYIETTAPIMPSAISGTGYFYVEIWTPTEWTSAVSDVEIAEVRLAPTNSGASADGEFHTFQRTTKPSAQIKDIKKVATGDDAVDLYLGTIYKTDALTPTETWFRKDITEAKPILQIMGEELMRMQQLPTRTYSGDIYGFISYMDVVTINSIDGLFMILEYSYNTKANIISLVMRQILGDELGDIDYEMTLDYGKTIKPTIVG